MEAIADGASREHRSRYLYPNGSEIVLGGLDKPGRITSTAWDIIFINEAIELREEAWDTLASRLSRPGRDPRFGFLIADTNPGDPSHWLKKRIEDGQTAFWDTGHKANPAMWTGRNWTPEGAAYLDRLRNLKGTRRKRYYDGLWAAGEGQWFGEFTDANVTERAKFDPMYPVHLAVDCGVHTGAVWCQIRLDRFSGETTITVFGDFYSFNKSAYDNARAILTKTVDLCGGRFDRGVCDPAGNAASPVGPTVIGEYRRAGLYLDQWPSYPGSVSDGLTLIDSFVSVDPPALLVHPSCTDLINAFANYKRAEQRGQFIDRPKDPQHPYEELMDALRGALQDKFPEGRRPEPALTRVPARSVF